MNNSVSIITPLYNSEYFLPKTIGSVLEQTYQDWEMIIVDDCSSDKSFDVAKKFANKDRRIKVTQLSSNQGPAVARNKAIELARGRYIAFLDSDDIWASKKLEKQINFMQKEGYALTYTCYKLIDREGNLVGKKKCLGNRLNYYDMLKSNKIGCLTAIYDSNELGKVYMPNILKRQDYALWLKILKKIDYAYCLPQYLGFYRLANSSVSSNKVNLVKYNWKLFNEIEDFSRVKSFYYLSWNILTKLFG